MSRKAKKSFVELHFALKELYDDVCKELSSFINNEDPEMTDGDWADVFYYLLTRVKNALEEIDDTL